ncbi:hypothetical protein ABH940_002673 [Streptacidiphilus sp. BW17]
MGLTAQALQPSAAIALAAAASLSRDHCPCLASTALLDTRLLAKPCTRSCRSGLPVGGLLRPGPERGRTPAGLGRTSEHFPKARQSREAGCSSGPAHTAIGLYQSVRMVLTNKFPARRKWSPCRSTG